MPYDIQVHESAASGSRRLVSQMLFYRLRNDALVKGPQILNFIGRRKRLDAFIPHFEHVPPIWELRVGSFRVFYDVDEESRIVHVRAVRRKQHGQTTGDIP